MTALTYRNGVFIAVLILYVPALAIAVFLAVRHGIRQSPIWRLMIIFTLARVLSAAFELATITSPTNDSLYAGYVILLNIALSPLLLVGLQLLVRVTESISKAHTIWLSKRHIKVLQLLVTIGLVLGIAGGTITEENWGDTGIFNPSPVSKASTIIFIVVFVGQCAVTGILSRSISYAEPREKRCLYAVALSLPFLAVRVVYSAISNLKYTVTFSSLFGNVTILLCMVLIEEFIVLVIYEGVCLTLPRAGHSKGGHEMAEQARSIDGSEVVGSAQK